MADPVVTRHAIEVEHVRIESQKSFDEVKAALERMVPQLNTRTLELLGQGEAASALKLLEAGPDLSIFLARDHGATLQMAGQKKKALQYEIGNPLTASKMTRHKLPAALYAPLRVVLYENEAGHAVFEYDRPSSLFGQFGDEQVTAVGRELDGELERALLHAAE
ncbi:DUF302 domain-containing protein [Methyloferula stellata]|uniref:DUF302 domain-containing protein n=1 Tax=Methyloferula stellata TaxID=876270 RepID=UPI000360D898|nr:DUF302 domain-containing protein [Methyloferula stellata]